MTNLTFDTGKFYKTRDGRKAQIFMLNNGKGSMLGAYIHNDIWIECAYFEKGTFLNIGEHHLDLVSEWREPIKYSVELWGTEFAPEKNNFGDSICDYVFGKKGIWCHFPRGNCPIKYRVTVEEIQD